jgi:hypothetical protein
MVSRSDLLWIHNCPATNITAAEVDQSGFFLRSALGHDRCLADRRFADRHLANRGLLVNWLRVRQVGSGGNAYQAKRRGRNDQKFEHIQSLSVRNFAAN